MLKFVNNYILNSNQKKIDRIKPKVNIKFHKELPVPSMGYIRQAASLVAEINSLEPKVSGISDSQLKNKTQEFKEKINAKLKELEPQINDLKLQIQEASEEHKDKIKSELRNVNNSAFSEVLAEAFACVREVAKRNVGMRHFDAQIVGGIVLHEGKIAEMATGEGKTLAATLPAYLNALTGGGVHIITVNDYLAKRDSEWMGPIYEALGLSVGVIQHDIPPDQKRQAYNCDITYGTNNEFGFDYLRDNMVIDKRQLVQRPFSYAIVDEVDSILIDEARTPLIISGPTEESTDKYYTINKVVPKLKGRKILESEIIEAKYKGQDLSEGYDYIVDEKSHTAHLTDQGEEKACGLLGIANLHTIETMEYRHHILQGLKAHNLFKPDVDYVIKEGKVIIVDDFTGRLMPGRRWSDGLHQAVEAKEGLKIERENQTLATVTLQNYFRMYPKLSGMTGTAFTEAAEFEKIYGLDVVVMPTNRPLIRTNHPDCVFKTEKEKFDAVVEEIEELYKNGRPVLVGTISIEKSEHVSQMLKMKGITHQVLNAKYHEMEAQIIAQAGRFKGVTIATNMAGRGTDIILGGNPQHFAKNLLRQMQEKEGEFDEAKYKEIADKFRKEAEEEHKKVVGLEGLHIIGTERHEARRIDNQLRGRSGRQGDPGSSRFFVSFDDDLMRLFGSDRIVAIMNRLGLEDGQAIEHPWVSGSIEIAQKRVENHNFEIRKQLIEYDNVMNKQREIIYGQRRMILEGENLKEHIISMIGDIVNDAIDMYIVAEIAPDEWDWVGLKNWIRGKFNLDVSPWKLEEKNRDELKDFLVQQITDAYDEKEKAIGVEMMRHIEKMVMLQIVDTKWKDHLHAMDILREGIGLRAYGQRDPLVEYKQEALNMFGQMVGSIKDDTPEFIFKIQQREEAKLKGVFSPQQFVHRERQSFQRPPEPEQTQAQTGAGIPPKQKPIVKKSVEKVGRNDPCSCGSGKKYKKCCGK